MKKIVYISIIAALSIIMFSAVVSADGHGWGKLHGVYEMIANGSCLHSTNDFNETEDGFFKPNMDSEAAVVVWGATSMVQGTLIFNRDGSGTASGENYVIDFPPGRPGTGSIVRDGPFYFTFTFDVTHDGLITVKLTNGFELNGMVSEDKKTITLGSAYQYIPASYGGPAYCNYGRVLIRVGR